MFNDPSNPETLSRSIPKKIHFIWVGGDIPAEYLSNIAHYRTLARKSGFEVNLWTDQKAHISKPAHGLGLDLADLHLRNIRELDPSNAKLWHCIDEESVGAHNHAAAADILRLMILKQEGGYYFDVDLIPKLKVQEHDPLAGFGEDIVDNQTDKVTTPLVENFVIPDAPHGFLCYCEEWGMQDSRQKDDKPLYIRKLGNHALASTQNHAIVNLALDQILKNYQKYDKTFVEKEDRDQKILYPVSLKDVKRSANLRAYGGRRQLTIDASGPSVIKKAIGTFVEDKNIKDFSGFTFPLIARGDDIMIVMPNVQSHYANTWLGSHTKKALEFEDLPVDTQKDGRNRFRP